ncbi:MAG: DUF2339 domain-containing protein [Planctomycetota bacterium]
MELLGIALLLAIAVGWFLGVIAFFLVLRRGRQVRELRKELDRLRQRPSEAPEAAAAETVPRREGQPAEPEPVTGEEVPEKTTAEPVLPEEAAEESPAEAVAERIRKDWPRLEEKIGQQWLTWVGVIVLLVGTGFFVKYAFEQQWIGPTARVVLGIAAGVGLLAGGDRVLRRQMRPLGLGLLGGGLAVLYLSLYASFSLYALVPQAVAFGAMVLVTTAGVALAVLHDAMSVSFLAVLGGLLTPVLLSTGEDSRDALFGYLTVLNAGVLGVALFKRWRAVDLLAFIGTACLFGAWFGEFYQPAAMMPTLGWLAVFYVIFLLVPFVNHLRSQTAIPLERFVLALTNATAAFVAAWLILHKQYEFALAGVALAMSGCYLGLGVLTRERIAEDARALFGFIGMAVVFLTLAVPLALGLHGITLAWAAEAAVLVYLGYRHRYEPARIAGLGALVLVTIRLFAVHWPLHKMLFRPFLNPSFGTAICVPISAAVAAVVHQVHEEQGSARDRVAKWIGALGGAFLALVIVHAELYGWLAPGEGTHVALAAVTALWAGGSLAYLLSGLKADSPVARIAGLAPLAVALFIGAGHYFGDTPIPDGYLPVANVRFLAGLAAVLATFAYPSLLVSRQVGANKERTTVRAVFWLGTVALLVLLSAEAYHGCLEIASRQVALMFVSVVWAVYAAGLLVVGFWQRFRALRWAGLGLFLLTALKLVVTDIAGIKQVWRIVAFVVVGLLMIAAAYLYARVEKYVFAQSGEEE